MSNLQRADKSHRAPRAADQTANARTLRRVSIGPQERFATFYHHPGICCDLWTVGSRSVSKLTTATKRLLVGRPFRSDRLAHTLLPKRIALPVFASDALSSVAYAPGEIFATLSVAGLAAYAFAPWIAGLVALVMVVVVLSYRQNVHAYPSGGGDYEVVTKNLGPTYGVLVARVVLVDHILTVAVSTAAGVANIGSAIGVVGDHPVWFSVAIIVLVCAANLR